MQIFQNDNIEVDLFRRLGDEPTVIYISGQDSYCKDTTILEGQKFEAVNQLSLEELREIVQRLREEGIDL